MEEPWEEKKELEEEDSRLERLLLGGEVCASPQSFLGGLGLENAREGKMICG